MGPSGLSLLGVSRAPSVAGHLLASKQWAGASSVGGFAVHKQNVMRVSDGLFLAEVRKVAAQFSEVQYDGQLVDGGALGARRCAL